MVLRFARSLIKASHVASWLSVGPLSAAGDQANSCILALLSWCSGTLEYFFIA